MACERLRVSSAARLASEHSTADRALYVDAMCAPSRDVKDARSLRQEALKWVNDGDWKTSQVLLLHGHSGSGKSLYVSLQVNARVLMDELFSCTRVRY